MPKTVFDFSDTNIMVEFRILGADFDVDYITDCLSVTPSVFWKTGDKIEGKNYTRKHTCWEINTGYEESLDINTQLNKILSLLSSKTDDLIRLKKSFNLDYCIEIVINIENDIKPTMYLSKEVIEFAYMVGAEIDFDVYVY